MHRFCFFLTGSFLFLAFSSSSSSSLWKRQSTNWENELTEHPLSISGATENPLGFVSADPDMSLWSSFRGRRKVGQKDGMGGSSQLPNQDYEALKKRCLRDGCLFEDSTFPATLSSIGRGPLLRKLPPHLQWRRPPVRGWEGGF